MFPDLKPKMETCCSEYSVELKIRKKKKKKKYFFFLKPQQTTAISEMWQTLIFGGKKVDEKFNKTLFFKRRVIEFDDVLIGRHFETSYSFSKVIKDEGILKHAEFSRYV